MKQVLEKLNKIRAEIKVSKTKNEKLKYKAFTIDALNEELNDLLVTHRLGVSVSAVATQVQGCNKKSGVDNYGANFERESFVVNGMMKVTIVDLDSDDVIENTVPLVGMNSEGDPSKSLGSAMSYCYKYFWIAQLGLTDETLDPDSNAYDKNSKAPTAPELKPPSEADKNKFKQDIGAATTTEAIIKLEQDFLAQYQLTSVMKTGLAGLVAKEIARVKGTN